MTPSRRDVLRGVTAAAAGVALGVRDSPAQTTRTAGPASRPAVLDVSEIIRRVRGDDRVPGLWGGVVTTDGLRAAGASGVRKAGDATAAGPYDRVHLGSCTKAMTATLVGRLVQAGKLSLSHTLAACYPDLAAGANPRAAAVTVRQLLDHRGGMPANFDWSKLEATPGTMFDKRRAVVRHALAAAPEHAPGGTYVYSNAGYVILGAIVEAMTGRTWEDVMTAGLFDKLGMPASGFGPPGTKGRTDQPWGHRREGDAWRASQGDNPPVMGPAGRAHCSIADWGQYVAWTLRACAGDTPLLSRATQAALITPSAGDYAAGWVLGERPWAGGRTLMHNGSNTTWYCVTWLAPGRGFAVMAATNAGNGDGPKVCDELSSALIGWHRRPVPSPGRPGEG